MSEVLFLFTYIINEIEIPKILNIRKTKYKNLVLKLTSSLIEKETA
jgi:hypothetical protein